MKKKILAIVMLFTSFTLILFCGCGFYGKPSIEKLNRNLSEWYNIALPKNVEIESYASDIGPTDGEYFVVLNYDGSDEEFNSIFSYEGNTEILTEYYFKENQYERMHDITKNFSVPDFENKYGWLTLLRSEVDSDYFATTGDCCAILYFYDLNKLVVYLDDY
ncbi:MAG: hypothetical protein K2N23_03050 [Clostridia bacterium]|nr:hypothetical protein [Clostridia bacterium]